MSAPTEEELEIIPKFREKLQDLNLQGFINTDMGLLQWLRARDLHLGKAEEMLRKSLKWRHDNQIDQILCWKPPEEFAALCPIEFCGIDKENCPVVYIPYGNWDLRRIFNEGYRDHYINYTTKMFETLLHQAKNQVMPNGLPVTQFVSVVDVGNLSFRTLASIGAMNMALEATQSFDLNYPETMKKAIVINASRVFAAFFALVKPILSKRTFGKVEIHDNQVENWKKALLQQIDKDQLPQQILNAFTLQSHMANDDDFEDYISVTIGAAVKIPIRVEVKEKCVLNWSFRTENYDIGFSLIHDSQIVIPHSKVNAHL